MGALCLNIFKAKEKHNTVFETGRATEGISLDLSKANAMHLKYNTFEGMTSLRYFSFFYPPKLVNLVWLDLSYCKNLVAVPDLSRCPNLEHLYLQGCKSLSELPSHVQDMDRLIALDLRDCTNLRILPPKLNSKFLNHLRLSNCPKITCCPEISSRELEILDLMETPVKALPSAIHNIKQDGSLFLGSKRITSFLAISASLNQFQLCHTTIREMACYDDDHQSYLPRFVQLELVDNPQLKSLSRNIWKMVSQTLLLEDCPLIESLPELKQPDNGLTDLSIRGCRNLKSLPSGIDNLKSLQSLRFCGTNIKSLPACIQEFNQLSWLDFSFNKRLEFISCNMHALAQLSTLYLTGCLKIQSLQELLPNLLVLGVGGCKSLRALPSNICRLRLKELYFEDCPKLGSNLSKEIVRSFPNHATRNLHPQKTAMSISCDCIIGTTSAASWGSPVFGMGRTYSDYVYVCLTSRSSVALAMDVSMLSSLSSFNDFVVGDVECDSLDTDKQAGFVDSLE
ncbi:unnamed protein product [Linum tenue]|uniref:Uncharacterized protein n=1 Tax=Linum tenue TaxID=586396 RepID=A0AAV0Q689_9ROSI|nr:unnamed protein product [Linum tenue]